MTAQHPADSWRERAACLGYGFLADVDPWFTRDRSNCITREPTIPSRRRAMAYCARCEVRAECLTYALTYEHDHPARQHFGIYGGLTPNQRRNLTITHRRAS